jgi:hypothetical protein
VTGVPESASKKIQQYQKNEAHKREQTVDAHKSAQNWEIDSGRVAVTSLPLR